MTFAIDLPFARDWLDIELGQDDGCDLPGFSGRWRSVDRHQHLMLRSLVNIADERDIIFSTEDHAVRLVLDDRGSRDSLWCAVAVEMMFGDTQRELTVLSPWVRTTDLGDPTLTGVDAALAVLALAVEMANAALDALGHHTASDVALA